jgi:hypothetical protein
MFQVNELIPLPSMILLLVIIGSTEAFQLVRVEIIQISSKFC